MFLNNNVVVVIFSIIQLMESIIYYLQISQLFYPQKCHSYVIWERIFNNCKETKIRDFYIKFFLSFVFQSLIPDV